MARGKKKESALTPEEKLAQALVPVEEQPYKVPGNWCWVYAPSAFIIEYGKGISTKQLTEDGYPVFGANGQIGFYSEYMYESPKALMSCRGAYSGTMNKSLPYSFVSSNSLIIEDKPQEMSVDFIYYLFSALDSKRLVSGSAQPQVTVQAFSEFPVPLVPQKEQQRIVDRIEYLFAKLDEAKEKAQSVLDSFETRKAAILHKAFTGELTAKWRAERGETMDSWKQLSVESLCNSLKYGTAKKSQQDGNVVVIRMGNLQNGEIDWSDLAYSDDEEDIKKYRLVPGDVLFNRTNSPALVGKTSIYRGEYPAIYAGYLIKLDYDRSRITGDYLNYALNTTNAKEYCSAVKTDGVNQSNINAKKIGAYEFLVPTLEEQKEIVRILDSLIAKEQQAKKTVEAVLEKIDLLKKAILARAFRGELGTNDPTEESALELLKKVLDIPTEPKAPVKRTFIPKDLENQIKTELERKIIKLYIQGDTDIIPISQMMSVSSKKFELMDTLRSLQQRGILVKEDEAYKLLR